MGPPIEPLSYANAKETESLGKTGVDKSAWIKAWLCGLFAAFVDLSLKSTCDMVLMLLHVDSVSISALKSQSSLTETNFRGEKRNEQIF